MVVPEHVKPAGIAASDKPYQQSEIDRILFNLTSKSHLQRDRALSQLSVTLTSISAQEVHVLKTKLIELMAPNNPWYAIYGAIVAASKLLQSSNPPTDQSSANANRFSLQLRAKCEDLVTHSEPRVREAVSHLIQDIALVDGVPVWMQLIPILISHIEHSFALDEQQRLEEASRVAARELDEEAASAKLNGLRMVHETEGWRGLETMLLCFSSLADGCGKQLFINIGEQDTFGVPGLQDIVHFVEMASTHPNRFVREAGLKVMNSLAVAASSVHERFVMDLVDRCHLVIANGLQDNWSQVRFAASVATRTIMTGLGSTEKRKLYPVFLPRMCLNRHYVAEGVRNYSQHTWRYVIAADGRVYLERYMEECVKFYESQCEADNHAVREAACQSLGEAALRLRSEVVSPYVPRLIAGLIRCFKDESWPVRDHACQALADVVAEFHEIAEQTGRLPEIFDLFRAHLADNIPSVRENCANSFEKASCVFDVCHPVIGASRLSDVARDFIGRMQNQKESEDAPRISNSQFGASTQLAVDDIHTNQVMYSCGSLAPKLRRGGGCTDHGFVREKEPWEESDGGILLWRALMRNVNSRGVATGLFGDVVAAGIRGCEKNYPGRTRFLNKFLESISETVAWVSEEQLKMHLETLVRICVRSKDLSDISSRKVAVCRRCVQRVAGLRLVADTERLVMSQESKTT